MIEKKMKFFLLALLLLGTPAVAKNGEFLNAMCKSGNAVPPDALGSGFCLGAIASILR